MAIGATALTGASAYLALMRGEVPGAIYSNDAAFDNYHHGNDQLFENIYLAIKYYCSIEEWKWWEGYWGFI